jgi:hypothetical protein
VENIHTILIPDIHGRKFWEDALPYIKQGVPTIFLGDYLDVYSHEGILPNEAIENFEKIIDVAKTYSNVQLLLGNHDATYALDKYICNCRTDRKNFDKIQMLFINNFDLFKLCVKIKVDEKTFMISHAGIHPDWLNSYKEVFEQISEILNTKYEHIDDFINGALLKPFVENLRYSSFAEDLYLYKAAVNSLGAVGRERGGYDKVGSILWADIHEYNPCYVKEQFKYEQIVGHTMQYYSRCPAIISGIITCIDCFDCFFIDKEGDLRRLKDKVLAEDIWKLKNN